MKRINRWIMACNPLASVWRLSKWKAWDAFEPSPCENAWLDNNTWPEAIKMIAYTRRKSYMASRHGIVNHSSRNATGAQPMAWFSMARLAAGNFYAYVLNHENSLMYGEWRKPRRRIDAPPVRYASSNGQSYEERRRRRWRRGYLSIKDIQ